MTGAPTVLEAFDFLDRPSDSLRAYEAIPSELVSISQSVDSPQAKPSALICPHYLE